LFARSQTGGEVSFGLSQNKTAYLCYFGDRAHTSAQEADMDSRNRINDSSESLQLAGAIEIERSEKFAARQIFAQSKADVSDINEVDDAFALGFDLLF
jgi:hypothetical protein